MTMPSAVSPSPWLSWNATVLSVTEESPGVATYSIQLDDPDVARKYRIHPGQFNMLYVPGIGESAISVSGHPAEAEPLAHTIRAAGNVTQALARMGEGGRIGLRGPFGTWWPLEECEGRDLILVAGGIGMAPLRPVVLSVLANRERYGEVTLLMGARTPDGLLYREEWSEWKQQLDVQQTVDRAPDDWQGNVGVVTSLLDRLPVPRPTQTSLLTCGPEVMMWYTLRSALAQGLLSSAMWLSLERHMNCAIGFCGHCQLGPEFVCRDGPVVPYDRVAPFLKVKAL